VLLDTYKACGTNVVRAAAKMHLVMSVTGMGPRSLRITAERSADCRNLNVGNWVANDTLKESGLVVPIPLQRLPDQPPHPR